MRAGAVGLVHGVVAGQLEADVVLGQQDVPRLRVDLRLVLLHPQDLGRGEAGQRIVAGDLDQPLLAQAARASRRTAACVRWSFHRMAGRSTSPASSSSTRPCIWPVRPMAAMSPAGHACARPARGGCWPPCRPTSRTGSARTRAGAAWRGSTAWWRAEDRAGRVDQQRLGAGGRNVETKKKLSACLARVRLSVRQTAGESDVTSTSVSTAVQAASLPATGDLRRRTGRTWLHRM